MARTKLLLAIFLYSLSTLSYEIILTRIFSISLWYHFAFMVISIAMLGIGASGTLLSLYPKLKDPAKISAYGLLLGIGILLSYITANQIPFDPVRLSWDRIQLFYICLYYLVLSIPFFFFGMSITTAFSFLSEKAGLVYGADLLGAGLGSITVLLLMNITGPERVVVLISAAALIGVFLLGRWEIRIASLFFILIAVSLLFIPTLIEPRMSPYKGLQLALKFPSAEHIKTYNSAFSRIDIFKSPAVRFAPGLSLTYLDPLPEQLGLSIDGGEISAITRAEDKDSLRFLKYLPSALAYEMKNSPSPLRLRQTKGGIQLKKEDRGGFSEQKEGVLILEPKGGLEVLLAEYYGAKNIYKVDSNPLLIRILQSDLQVFSQSIYSKDTYHGMGRSWLKHRQMQFDVIDMPMMGASPSGSFGISEDYRFTVEAFKEYVSHLKDNGVLNINLFILPPPRIELRLLNTIIAAMDEMGIKNIDKNITAIRSWGALCILAKKTPFSPEEIESVKRFSREKRFDLVHYPGIKEEETNIFVKMPSNEYFKAFQRIINPETRKSFEQNYVFDIKPVHDEAPFFHYYLKLKNIKEIYKLMDEKWQYFVEEGYLLPIVFIQVLLLSVVLIFLPALPNIKAKVKVEKKNNLNLLLYFAFLGIGFMFAEIPLIQKMILPLENPSYAVAAVLTAMLMSSGAGSLLSNRFSKMQNPYILLAIAFLVLMYSLVLPSISDIIASHSMPLKIASIFLALIPLSLFMGIPFPLGLKILGQKNPNLIPWAWAINGCFSILAPLLAIMLAMVVGFKIVLWIGASVYGLAFLIFPSEDR